MRPWVIPDHELDEAEYWIDQAIKRPGQLHRDLGVPQDKKIPVGKLQAAAKQKGKVGQRARLALTLSKLRSGGKKRGKT